MRSSRGGRRGLFLLAGAMLLLVPPASARRRRFHENPHSEVTVVARVETAAQRTTHANGRSFEELSVTLLSVDPPEASGPEPFSFDTRRPVRIVHDLTCGGTWVPLSPGDRVEVRGEYVHTPRGGDLIHFTHPADRSCGGGGHVGGFLRRLPAPAAEARPPIPAEGRARFVAALRPVLSTRCGPCHEPGGKMYGRMPFDDPATVALHATRMAGRLSGEDRRTLEAWAAGLRQPEPESR